MQQSFGYILNRRPFRDSSLLLDIFTEDFGRICCVARPAKKRGKVVKGNTEPFRYLHLQWIGKGDVQTLTEADERGRHSIPPSELLLGIYLNELLLLLTQSHAPQPDLFSAYKYTLHKLGDSMINRHIMMRFELYLLNSLGYSTDLDEAQDTLGNTPHYYRFTHSDGLILNDQEDVAIHPNSVAPILISSELLLALQDIQNMQESQWNELRVFLDKVFSAITPRVINSRKLLNI